MKENWLTYKISWPSKMNYKELKTIKSKIIYILLFVVAVGIIVFLTVVNKGNLWLSETCRQITVNLFEKFGGNPEGQWWNTITHFRKIGHIIEYFILGIAAYLLLNKLRYAMMICITLSIADQVLKIFIPQRHFDYKDLVFDAVGYVTGIAVLYLTQLVIGKIKKDFFL